MTDAVIGMTHLLKLTWSVWCPHWIFTKTTDTNGVDHEVEHSSKDNSHENSMTDTTGTLVALKDMLQSNLPRTEILVVSITDDQELPVLPNNR